MNKRIKKKLYRQKFYHYKDNDYFIKYIFEGNKFRKNLYEKCLIKEGLLEVTKEYRLFTDKQLLKALKEFDKTDL